MIVCAYIGLSFVIARCLFASIPDVHVSDGAILAYLIFRLGVLIVAILGIIGVASL